MKQGKIFLGLLIITTLISCDPAKILTIQNRTGKDLTFRMIKNPNSNFFIPASDTVSYKLAAKGDNSKIMDSYGFGIWSKDDLNALQNSIKVIQVISSSDTTTYRTKEELQSIIPQKRRGIVNNFLKINIE